MKGLMELAWRGYICHFRRTNKNNTVYVDSVIVYYIQDGHSDIYISGMKSRNRALNGDVVAIQLFDRDQWKVSVWSI